MGVKERRPRLVLGWVTTVERQLERRCEPVSVRTSVWTWGPNALSHAAPAEQVHRVSSFPNPNWFVDSEKSVLFAMILVDSRLNIESIHSRVAIGFIFEVGLEFRAVATADAEEAHASSVLSGFRQMRQTFWRFALPEPRKTYAGSSPQKNNWQI